MFDLIKNYNLIPVLGFDFKYVITDFKSLLRLHIKAEVRIKVSVRTKICKKSEFHLFEFINYYRIFISLNYNEIKLVFT